MALGTKLKLSRADLQHVFLNKSFQTSLSIEAEKVYMGRNVKPATNAAFRTLNPLTPNP